MDREKAFAKALSQYQKSCTELFGLIRDEEKGKIKRWEEERPNLELLITSLNQTCDILKKDKKKLAADLTAKQQATAAASSIPGKQSQRNASSDSISHHGAKDPASLQRELDELTERLQATELEITKSNKELSACERADEREYLSTKCVVLQDTRRILSEELQSLRSALARMDARSRQEEQRRAAAEAGGDGWAAVAALEEQLERATSRLDRVKQRLYFPEAKGYRFSSGSGGVYVGARDLHLSEVSGRFEFTCEPVAPARAPGTRGAGPGGGSGGGGGAGGGAGGNSSRVARLTVALGGVSASTALAERSDSRRGGLSSMPSGSNTDPAGRSTSAGSGSNHSQSHSQHSSSGNNNNNNSNAAAQRSNAARSLGQQGSLSRASMGMSGRSSSGGGANGFGAGAVAEGTTMQDGEQDPAALSSLMAAPPPGAAPPDPAATSSASASFAPAGSSPHGRSPTANRGSSGGGGGGGGGLLAPVQSTPPSAAPSVSQQAAMAAPSAPVTSVLSPASRPLAYEVAANPGFGSSVAPSLDAAIPKHLDASMQQQPQQHVRHPQQSGQQQYHPLQQQQQQQLYPHQQQHGPSQQQPPQQQQQHQQRALQSQQPYSQPPLSQQQHMHHTQLQRQQQNLQQQQQQRPLPSNQQPSFPQQPSPPQQQQQQHHLPPQQPYHPQAQQPHLHPQHAQQPQHLPHPQQPQYTQQHPPQQPQRPPLQGFSSGPPPATQAPPLEASGHRRAPSHDPAALVALAGTGGGGGRAAAVPPLRSMQPPPPQYGLPPTPTPPAPSPRAKGEGVANFLSGLKNKKERLKSIVGGLVGDRDREKLGNAAGNVAPGGGGGQSLGPGSTPGQGHGFASAPGPTGAGTAGAAAVGPPELYGSAEGGAGGRLRTQMMEKLHDGFSEGRDKLSRFGKVIATKAPEALRDIKTKIRPGQQPGAGGGGGMDGGLDGGDGGGGGGSPHSAGAPAASTPRAQSSAAAAAVDADTASAAEGGGAGGGGDEGLLGGFEEDFDCRPSRKGVYVQLLGEQVQLLGERGTKVPDTSIREIMLEVEVAVTAVFEYHTALPPAAPANTGTSSQGATGAGGLGGGGLGFGGGAWLAPEPVSFNILQLDHRMRGNTIPLPRTLLKGLLNAYMPGLLTRLLSGLLPAELGAYTAACGEAQALSGEFKVAGPSLTTTVASFAPPPKAPTDPARRAQWAAAQAAASRARAMLGLSEAQAAAVSELFGGSGRPSLLPDSAAVSSSISGLCRLYVSYSGSGLWQPLLGLMDRALQDAFDFHGVPPAERFPLPTFLDTAVCRLVRKPLRIAFTLERLSLALDCDAALATLRDYFERLARDFDAKGGSNAASSSGANHGGGKDSGGGAGGPPREPLEVQLQLLDLWHASLAKMLRSFKQRFRSAGATLLASADRRVFQFGAESVSYDGPLKLQVPLDLAMDPDGSFLLDVRLPDREQATNSITSLLTEVMYSLSNTHNNTAAGATGAAPVAAETAPHAAAAAGTGGSAFASVQQQLQQRLLQQQTAQGAGAPQPPSPLSSAAAAGFAAAAATAAAAASASGGGSRNSGGGGGGGGSSGGGSPSKAAGGMASVATGSPLFEIGQEWAAALAEGMPEGGALAAGTAPLLQNPVVGQLCVKKLALNLRLDEERIVELLARGGGAAAARGSGNSGSETAAFASLPLPFSPLLPSSRAESPTPAASSAPTAASTAASAADADIAGRLLGCYGDLFTASLDTGWRREGEADGAAQRPCCMLTVQSNDITRLRAQVEGLWFQSSVSPRLAVRVLQAVVIALVLKFHAADSYSIRFWNRAFNQLHEYLSRGSLDVTACLSMRAAMDRPTGRLRVELSGQDLNNPSSGTDKGGSGTGLLGNVCPLYLLNDVNLMTVLDSVKLLSETAPPVVVAADSGAQQQQGE